MKRHGSIRIRTPRRFLNPQDAVGILEAVQLGEIVLVICHGRDRSRSSVEITVAQSRQLGRWLLGLSKVQVAIAKAEGNT